MEEMPNKANPGGPGSRIDFSEVLQNVVIGLTVSFVALSLGAALGILSGRGAFAGMFAAGTIALITSLLGGTRVQCSGPTAPMSAVTATVVAFAYTHLPSSLAGTNPDHFINLVIILSGGMLLLMGILRLGKFIALVPNVVISGFMTGIALLIWIDQVKSIFGLGGKTAMGGLVLQNFLVAMATVTAIFLLAPLMKKIVPAAAKFLPATLLAIVGMTVVANLFRLPIEHVELTGSVNSISGLTELALAQWPANWSMTALTAALPFALQLAMLCYLDTLLTSLVVDKMTEEKTLQDRELMAQGLANGTVALLGGIPGAQATIRSVLMVKENATLRLAGILVGVFVLIEMVLFQGLINLIPKAVFAGVLFKVGYDVFDFQPLRLYAKEVAKYRAKLFENFFSRHDDDPIFVTNREMLIILGTAATTVVFSLNVAVAGFTALFYLHNSLLNKKNPLRDLQPVIETKAFGTEN